jgi:hypothetical protein
MGPLSIIGLGAFITAAALALKEEYKLGTGWMAFWSLGYFSCLVDMIIHYHQ